MPVLLALLALPSAAQAQQPSEEGLPLWEVGVGAIGVSQQAYPGASEQVGRGLVFPYLIYRGRFLRADRESIGLRAIKTPTFEVDVSLAGAFGSNADDVEARRGMPALGTLVEFGPRLKWNLGAGPADGRMRAEFALRGVFDLSDSLRNRGYTFEPRLVYDKRAGSWRYSVSVATIFGSRRLADTFYGVAPVYATTDRPAYQADSGLITSRLGVTMARELSRDWRVFGFARIDSVAGAANRDSPLVRDTVGGSIGAGLVYTWARSSTLVRD